jgi:hypothetical protein
LSQLIVVIVDFSACHAEGRGFEPRRSRQYRIDLSNILNSQIGPVRPVPTFAPVTFPIFGGQNRVAETLCCCPRAIEAKIARAKFLGCLETSRMGCADSEAVADSFFQGWPLGGCSPRIRRPSESRNGVSTARRSKNLDFGLYYFDDDNDCSYQLHGFDLRPCAASAQGPFLKTVCYPPASHIHRAVMVVDLRPGQCRRSALRVLPRPAHCRSSSHHRHAWRSASQ